ncbi:zinc finger protein 582-like [Cavia porcellus]|uniref:zinc finger protein 582-like n=1 Tax=Cavia porcellus TaxID=10141 RepID=UPI002FE41236
MGEMFRNMTAIGGLGDIQEAEKECKIYWKYLRNDKLGKSYGHTSWNQCKEVFLCTAEGNLNVKETETHHNVQIHEKYCNGEKPYVCQQCGECFTKSGHCKQHERIHTGEKPYVCKQCGKAFNTWENCKIDERIHTGEKPYVCKECGKGFTRHQNCKQHERIHTGEKLYICKQCWKDLPNKNIVSNMKVHTQDRTSVYKHHENFLSTSPYCIMHEKLHTGQKTYICKECGKGFSRNAHCPIHYKIYTVEKPVYVKNVGKLSPHMDIVKYINDSTLV